MSDTEVAVAKQIVTWDKSTCGSTVSVLQSVRHNTLQCPSTTTADASAVFGIFDETTMRNSFLLNPIHLGETIKKSRCVHWANRCQLGWIITKSNNGLPDESPSCPISKSCRWKVENGVGACAACRSIRNVKVSHLLAAGEVND